MWIDGIDKLFAANEVNNGWNSFNHYDNKSGQTDLRSCLGHADGFATTDSNTLAQTFQLKSLLFLRTGWADQSPPGLGEPTQPVASSNQYGGRHVLEWEPRTSGLV